jgi:hypothetical protein
MPLGRYRVAKPKLVAKKFHFFSPRVFVTPVALYNKAGDAQRPKWQGRLAASSRALAMISYSLNPLPRAVPPMKQRLPFSGRLRASFAFAARERLFQRVSATIQPASLIP